MPSMPACVGCLGLRRWAPRLWRRARSWQACWTRRASLTRRGCCDLIMLIMQGAPARLCSAWAPCQCALAAPAKCPHSPHPACDPQLHSSAEHVCFTCMLHASAPSGCPACAAAERKAGERGARVRDRGPGEPRAREHLPCIFPATTCWVAQPCAPLCTPIGFHFITSCLLPPCSQSGRRGAVTIATNMAGRGTDILLGGNPGAPQQWVCSAVPCCSTVCGGAWCGAALPPGPAVATRAECTASPASTICASQSLSNRI